MYHMQQKVFTVLFRPICLEWFNKAQLQRKNILNDLLEIPPTKTDRYSVYFESEKSVDEAHTSLYEM